MRPKLKDTWKPVQIKEPYHRKLLALAKKNHRTICGQIAAMVDAEQNNSGGSQPQAETALEK